MSICKIVSYAYTKRKWKSWVCEERQALRWVQKCIGQFVEDPAKGTMCVRFCICHSFIAEGWLSAAGASAQGSSRLRCTWWPMKVTTKASFVSPSWNQGPQSRSPILPMVNRTLMPSSRKPDAAVLTRMPPWGSLSWTKQCHQFIPWTIHISGWKRKQFFLGCRGWRAYIQSLLLAWLPRPDSVFLTDNPQTLVAQGEVANILIVNGM